MPSYARAGFSSTHIATAIRQAVAEERDATIEKCEAVAQNAAVRLRGYNIGNRQQFAIQNMQLLKEAIVEGIQAQGATSS